MYPQEAREAFFPRHLESLMHVIESREWAENSAPRKQTRYSAWDISMRMPELLRDDRDFGLYLLDQVNAFIKHGGWRLWAAPVERERVKMETYQLHACLAAKVTGSVGSRSRI